MDAELGRRQPEVHREDDWPVDEQLADPPGRRAEIVRGGAGADVRHGSIHVRLSLFRLPCDWKRASSHRSGSRGRHQPPRSRLAPSFHCSARQMNADGDPIAVALRAEYREARMPNLKLNDDDGSAGI